MEKHKDADKAAWKKKWSEVMYMHISGQLYINDKWACANVLYSHTKAYTSLLIRFGWDEGDKMKLS